MKLYITDELIDKAIASVFKRGVSLQKDIHVVACSILRVWNTSGDVSKAVSQTNALVEAMPGMSRRNALKSWVEAHAGFVWNADENKFVYNAKKTTIADSDVRQGIDVPFWDFKPEPPYKPFDLDKTLDAVIDRANKRIKDGVKKEDNIKSDRLSALKTLIDSWA